MRLAVAINEIIETMSQTDAAQRLRINQPKISALVNYRLTGFSVERLIDFLNALGRYVEIVIRKPRSRRAGKILVTSRIRNRGQNRGAWKRQSRPDSQIGDRNRSWQGCN